jgi:hypothetical protein
VEVEVEVVEGVVVAENAGTTFPRIRMRAVITMLLVEVAVVAEEAGVAVVVEVAAAARVLLLMIFPSSFSVRGAMLDSGGCTLGCTV